MKAENGAFNFNYLSLYFAKNIKDSFEMLRKDFRGVLIPKCLNRSTILDLEM